MDDPKDMEDSRKVLLHYYNSQTMTHGGYIIALVVGIATLISRWTEFNGNFLVWTLFIGMNSLIMGLGVYIVGRSMFWGALACEIMNAPPSKLDPNQYTLMHRLHVGAKEQTERRVVAKHFQTFRPDVIIVITVILFTSLLLLTFQFFCRR